MMNRNNVMNVGVVDSISIGKKASILVSMAFGIFLLYGVGFAMPTALHNVAHDSRHSVAFPCH